MIYKQLAFEMFFLIRHTFLTVGFLLLLFFTSHMQKRIVIKTYFKVN